MRWNVRRARLDCFAVFCASCASSATPSAQVSSAPAGPPCRAIATPSPPAIVADPRRVAVGLETSLVDMVLDGERARLTARAAPFLRRGQIWDLEYRGKYHPTYACIGELPGAPSVDLSSGDRFVAFARAAGLALSNDEARVVYVKTYLELDGLHLVESEGDLPFAVGPSFDSGSLTGLGADASPEERGVEDALRVDYARLVQQRRRIEANVVPSLAPLCLHGSGPFRGVVDALDAVRDLLRVDVTLQGDGSVTTNREVVARDVPVRSGR